METLDGASLDIALRPRPIEQQRSLGARQGSAALQASATRLLHTILHEIRQLTPSQITVMESEQTDQHCCARAWTLTQPAHQPNSRPSRRRPLRMHSACSSELIANHGRCRRGGAAVARGCRRRTTCSAPAGILGGESEGSLMVTRLDAAYWQQTQHVRNRLPGFAIRYWKGLGSRPDEDCERILRFLAPEPVPARKRSPIRPTPHGVGVRQRRQRPAVLYDYGRTAGTSRRDWFTIIRSCSPPRR